MTDNEAMRFIGQAVIESEKALEALQSIKSEAERIGKIGEYYANLDNCVKEIEACRVAIQALEEIQQYREIGTVEDYWKLNEMCKDYSAIGTIDEFKALKEKNEPKKPQEISWGATKCPICGQEFGFNSHFNHCSNCGQKLDFGKEE